LPADYLSIATIPLKFPAMEKFLLCHNFIPIKEEIVDDMKKIHFIYTIKKMGQKDKSEH